MEGSGDDRERAAGAFAAPEGAACVAALRKLYDNGFLKKSERVVLYNTGAGLKYAESLQGPTPKTLGRGEALA